MRTGEFLLYPDLVEGENTFTLTVNGTVSATTKVYLDSVAPTIAISRPLNNSTLGTTRVNVTGTFMEASLKRITVNGVLAFITGSGTFEARNVLLEAGANTITATAEDISGNTTSATINITGSATLVDPVQLTATPVAGFAPLSVTFALPVQNVSGATTIDYIGDNASQTPGTPSRTYSAGQYFPVATIQTADGNRFSSLGGWNAGAALRVNVQEPPQIVNGNGSGFAVSDPVDLKIGGQAGHLYVLSRSGRFVNEYDANESLVRSLTLPTGSAPTGLDVDSAGNIYVALSGLHQVAKYHLDNGIYALDSTFNDGAGLIGKVDGTPGTGNGEFNTPYDVAVAADGSAVYVSDSSNNRAQKFSQDGLFQLAIGLAGQLSSPKGITFGGGDDSLFVVDGENNRVVRITRDRISDSFGTAGISAGEYQNPFNISSDSHNLFVADTGNSRIQKVDRINFSLLSETGPLLGLNHPHGLAVFEQQSDERIYVADTGNNRVILVRFPKQGEPLNIWTDVKQALATGDMAGALRNFSSESIDYYRDVLNLLPMTVLNQIMTEAGAPSLYSRDDEEAQYIFSSTIDGAQFVFTLIFKLENGVWKIERF